ncbi:MAG: pilus assembly protein PilP [Anaerolineaceae bacterium]|nr:pilus assembly protein PilP [Anaerolineaceae bacterium]
MMMVQRNLTQWLVILCVMVFLAACGEKAPVTPEAHVKAQPTKKETIKPVASATDGDTAAVEAPLKYTFVTENRRDPFQPFILIKRPVDADADLSAQTPLQQYETMQYKLSAVIVGYNQPMVMVIAPDGRSYVVRKGMKIGKNGGTVIQINKEGFLVEEKYRDLSDVIRTNILEIKLPKREGV